MKPGFSVEDIYNRAKITLENCIKQGTTRIRTHAEIDLPVGTKCIEALKMLQKEYAWAVDLEICAFAQEGLANVPEADKALVEAIEMGATSIGGAPNYDTDHPAHINRVFELAREYDIHVDLHIDSGHDPAAMDNMLVAELTEKYKYGGRVAMGHMTKVAALPPDKQKDIARRLADVGAAVTVLPATDLFVLARHRDHDVPRCITDANLFAEQGCNCSISTNNILNPFTPFGDCSLIRMANMHANVLQVGRQCPAHGTVLDDQRPLGPADQRERLRHQGGPPGRGHGDRCQVSGGGRCGQRAGARGVQARPADREPASRRIDAAAVVLPPSFRGAP